MTIDLYFFNFLFKKEGLSALAPKNKWKVIVHNFITCYRRVTLSKFAMTVIVNTLVNIYIYVTCLEFLASPSFNVLFQT